MDLEGFVDFVFELVAIFVDATAVLYFIRRRLTSHKTWEVLRF